MRRQRVGLVILAPGLFALAAPSCAPEQKKPFPPVADHQRAAALARPSPSPEPGLSPIPRATVSVRMPESPLPSPAMSPSPLGPNERQRVADRVDGIDRQYAPRVADVQAAIEGKRQELITIDASAKQQASRLELDQRNREFQAQQNNELLRELSSRSAQEAEKHERAAMQIQQTIYNTAAPEDSELMVYLRSQLAQQQRAAAELRSQSAQQLAAQSANTAGVASAGNDQMEAHQAASIDLEVNRSRLTADLNDLERQLNQLNQEWKQARAEAARQS